MKDEAFRIEIWGALLDEKSFRLESTRPIGAGIHIWAKGESGKRIHIKVAQPRDVTTRDNGVTIPWARYIQLDDRTVPAVNGSPALRILPLHADRTGAI